MIVAIVIAMVVSLIISNYVALWYLNNARASVPDYDEYADLEDAEAGVPATVPNGIAKKGLYVFAGCYFASLICTVVAAVIYLMSASKAALGLATGLVISALVTGFRFKSLIVVCIAIIVMYMFALGTFSAGSVLKEEASIKDKLYAFFIKLNHAKVSKGSSDVYIEDAMTLYRNFGMVTVLLICLSLLI